MATGEKSILPWLMISHEANVYSVYEHPYSFAALGLADKAVPFLITLVGANTKTQYLQRLTEIRKDAPLAHGQVLLWSDTHFNSSVSPVIYVDCEIQCYERPPFSTLSRTHRHISRHLSSTKPASRAMMGNLLCGRMFAALGGTVCYFARDLGGLRGVAKLLAQLIALPPVSDIPSTALPEILVIHDRDVRKDDRRATEFNAYNEVLTAICTSLGSTEAVTLSRLEVHFRKLSIVLLPPKKQDRPDFLQKKLAATRLEGINAGAAAGTRFSNAHTRILMTKILNHLCIDHTQCFSFAHSSRPTNFHPSNMKPHIKELIRIVPSEEWIFKFICPLLSSAIHLAFFPPGSHRFPMQWLFHRLLKDQVQDAFLAIENEGLRGDALKALEHQLMIDSIHSLDDGQVDLRSHHERRLISLRPYLTRAKTNRTCIACLMSTPEKCLACGHSVCDTCIRVFGKRSLDDRHGFILDRCPLCGVMQQGDPFRLIPPTAGIRALFLEGGGIKGVNICVFLKAISTQIVDSGANLRDFFDLVYGTSSGGLIAIGIFLMEWDVSNCIQKFEDLAMSIFKKSTLPFLSVYLKDLALALFKDGRYSAHEIDAAFQDSFGAGIKMFNPLNTSTKVAVTATTAKKSQACVFANYNGGIRAGNCSKIRDRHRTVAGIAEISQGYSLVRAHKPEHDITLSQAAMSTSAAPWFFKTVNVDHLGTYQDGALKHNNPTKLAMWEADFLWPNKGPLDIGLSIGTGTSETPVKVGPQSPVKIRFFLRVLENFMDNMDGESQWKDFLNNIRPSEKDRYHRLNIALKSPQPSLDSVSDMQGLKESVTDHIRSTNCIQPVVNSLLASVFYFEFDELPLWTDRKYSCTGHIFCRLPFNKEARRKFLEYLQNTSSYFSVMGQPVKCVNRHIPKSAPIFKRKVQFCLANLDNYVDITITGLTTMPHRISGLPRSARQIINMQELLAPFGRSTYVTDEKPLPRLPSKRKFAELDLI